MLRQIDREMPYHILFLWEYEVRYRAAIGYREATAGQTAFKVDRYYYTEWLEADESATLKESIEQQKQREQLEKQIAALEAKIRKEKQPKKKFELVSKLKKLQEGLTV